MPSPFSTTPGLTTIPTELFDEIASYLDRSTLNALSLSCKSGNISANVVLYRAYVNLEPPAKAPIHLFLRTICERPDLAEKVQEVNVRGWRSEYEVAIGAAWRGMVIQSVESASRQQRNEPSYSNKDNPLRTTHAQRSKIFIDAAIMSGLITRPKGVTIPALKKSAVWYTTLNEDAYFVRLIGCGVEDAHVLLMIGLLPKLQSLRVDGLSPYPLLDWHHFLSRSTTALRAIRNLLTHGSITKITEPIVSSTLQYLDIMPSLEGLEVGNIAIKGNRFSNERLSSKSLSKFYCMNSAMGLRLLGKILHGQRLVSFRLIPGHRYVDLVAGALFSFSDITKLLTTSKSNLVHFVLYPTSPSTEPTRLIDFDRLKSMDTVQPGLLNTHPDNLDPETIASVLREQMPIALTELSLQHLLYEPQV